MKGARGKVRVWRDVDDVAVELLDVDNGTQGYAVIPVEEFRALWRAVEKVVEEVQQVRDGETRD